MVEDIAPNLIELYHPAPSFVKEICFGTPKNAIRMVKNTRVVIVQRVRRSHILRQHEIQKLSRVPRTCFTVWMNIEQNKDTLSFTEL
jgi:hypothetical protein